MAFFCFRYGGKVIRLDTYSSWCWCDLCLLLFIERTLKKKITMSLGEFEDSIKVTIPHIFRPK